MHIHHTTQVEYANVLVINKVDTVSEQQVRQLELVLRKLNRAAKVGRERVLRVFLQHHSSIHHFLYTSVCQLTRQIIRAEHGAVPAGQVLSTGSFDRDQLEQSFGWLAELNAFYGGEQLCF